MGPVPRQASHILVVARAHPLCFSAARQTGGLNIEFLWRPADKLKSAINLIILNKDEDDAEEFKVNAICLCGEGGISCGALLNYCKKG